jgi:SAM-dependent methyltransferase
LLLDHLEGRAGEPELERDDGHVGPAMGAEWFFAEPDEWIEAERAAFERVRGRVLDIGAGAGRHSLEAQRRGLEAVAIDASPGAVEVCRRRGVRDARLLPLAEVDERLGVFDTVLLLCGNLGLAGGADETSALLERLHGSRLLRRGSCSTPSIPTWTTTRPISPTLRGTESAGACPAR